MGKTFLASTKNKNDFLTYENCLEKDFEDELQKKLHFNFTLKTTYILAMIDDNETKANLSDSILLEQYNYWLSYCLPYPQKNETEICSKRDYSEIIKFLMEISFNMEHSEVDIISISKKDFEKSDKIYCVLNFIIIFIPIIIQIFLYIYYSISFYRFKKRHKFNQFTVNQEEEMKKINIYLQKKKLALV